MNANTQHQHKAPGIDQPEHMISLAKISRQCNIPTTTVSGFIRIGLRFLVNPDNRCERLVKVSDLNEFLTSTKAGKHRGKCYPSEPLPHSVVARQDDEQKEMHPKVDSLDLSENAANEVKPRSKNPGSENAPSATLPVGQLEYRKARRPNQLKRFKRDARRLNIEELQWAIRYCQDRLFRRNNQESDQVNEWAFKMAQDIENEGIRLSDTYSK